VAASAVAVVASAGATAIVNKEMTALMTGPLLMVASAAAWALGLVLTKVTLDSSGAEPSSVLLVQLGASVGVLAAACLVSGAWPRSGWRHGWVGLLEPGISYQLALAGLALTSATTSAPAEQHAKQPVETSRR
jgi:drug/metabolite transporter (DMT)-like permease